MDSDYIKVRKGPERDREIDTIVGNIRKAAQTDVKVITYHWEVIPYRRNGKITGRSIFVAVSTVRSRIKSRAVPVPVTTTKSFSRTL